MTRTFTLCDNEEAALARWRETHDPKCIYAHKSGAIGGALTFQFTPTSIGVLASVSCSCGAHETLTGLDDL